MRDCSADTPRRHSWLQRLSEADAMAMTRVKHSPEKGRTAANPADVLALIARESAVFAREQAADQREEMLTATARHRALSDAQMREANEQLVIASVRALRLSDAAEQSAKQM